MDLLVFAFAVLICQKVDLLPPSLFWRFLLIKTIHRTISAFLSFLLPAGEVEFCFLPRQWVQVMYGVFWVWFFPDEMEVWCFVIVVLGLLW